MEIIEKSASFDEKNILNITQDEYTDDFRRVQEESRRLVQEGKPTIYQRGDKALDDDTRERLAKVYGGLLSRGTKSDVGQWVDLTSPEDTSL